MIDTGVYCLQKAYRDFGNDFNRFEKIKSLIEITDTFYT
ncbi:hypothetical protein GAPWKB11_1520 [Gilliamella apicola]|nr:hypothetical protein GAPWKB11_1520 [Gilliamella apicola]